MSRPASESAGTEVLDGLPGADSPPDTKLAEAPGRFAPGDLVLLVDDKNRQQVLRLAEGEVFHTHAGGLSHDDVLGATEGVMIRSSRGSRYRALRPGLAEFVLNMRRGAQVIYPKDLGPILMLADIAPGQRVLESGVGSGALSMALLRAGAHVLGYEIRPDFARRAVNNVRAFLGPEALGRYEVVLADCYEGFTADGTAGVRPGGLDRVLLDLPEPWRVVEHARQALRPGGILLAYTPSVIQVSHLRKSLSSATWGMATTCEVLQRAWHVVGDAVRPDHRMVGHTGFLTHARHLAG